MLANLRHTIWKFDLGGLFYRVISTQWTAVSDMKPARTHKIPIAYQCNLRDSCSNVAVMLSNLITSQVKNPPAWHISTQRKTVGQN